MSDRGATEAAGEEHVGLEGLGWDQRWADLHDDADVDMGDDPRVGRIARTHRVGFDVFTSDGRLFAVTRARQRDPMRAPATGDWVVLTDVADIDEPVITCVLDRRSAVVRRDPADRAAPQVLAANADVVAVVQGADRPINPRRLERQLAVAHGSEARVVVVLSKADLDPDGDAARQLKEVAIGQEVLVTGANDGVGIDELDAMTDGGHTLVLLGESGAGKSSLVNAVLGHEATAVGMVREGDSKGRHTTTRRTLLPLPTGGALLDTPGVRAVGLWPGWADLEAVFPEIAEAAEACRFSDCSHRREPGCGVTGAVEDGTVRADRLEAWRALDDELEATRTEVERKDWR